MGGFTGDLKAAARRLIAAPLFTAFAVLSIAIGVGVTTAAYSIVANLFFRGLNVPDPGRLVFIVTPYSGHMRTGSISDPDFQDIRSTLRSFSTLSASQQSSMSVTTKTTAAFVPAESVDGAYFSSLGVRPALGRFIQSSDVDGRARVAVISYRLWRSRFSSDAHITGQAVRLGGNPFEIVGVAGEGFSGPRNDMIGTDVWIPYQSSPAATRDQRSLLVFGRLSPTSSSASASTELDQVARRLDEAYPPPGWGKRGVLSERLWSARSAAEMSEEDTATRRFGLTLIALVALVLVVACTNLANLVLARGTTRQQEITVRFALGASRWRLVRGQMTESLLLAIAGAIGSYLVFRTLQLQLRTEFTMGVSQLGTVALQIDPRLNANVLIIAATSLFISLVVFGLEPALQLTRNPDIRGELAIGGNPRSRRQRILLRWQVLAATGFFILSTMFVKYAVLEMRHDSGIALDRIGVALTNFDFAEWNEDRTRRTLERVVDVALKKPGVEAVAVATSLPFGTPYDGRPVLSVPGQPASGFDGQRAMVIAATPAIFRVMGVAVVRGRGFDDRDTAASARVAVITGFTARQLFGSIDNAVGRDFVIEDGTGRKRTRVLTSVVGVTEDTDVGNLLARPRANAFVPYIQRFAPRAVIVARATGDPAGAVKALREAVQGVDPEIVVNAIGNGRSVLAGPFQFIRGLGLTTVGLGTLTLLLAMVGLFGIQSHIVSQRTKEIGVRMSFGATTKQIRWMVLSDGARPVVDGMLLGIAAGVIGRIVLRNYLDVDASALDPWAFVIIPIPVTLASLLACYLPASRAAAVDPNVALRHL